MGEICRIPFKQQVKERIIIENWDTLYTTRTRHEATTTAGRKKHPYIQDSLHSELVRHAAKRMNQYDLPSTRLIFTAFHDDREQHPQVPLVHARTS